MIILQKSRTNFFIVLLLFSCFSCDQRACGKSKNMPSNNNARNRLVVKRENELFSKGKAEKYFMDNVVNPSTGFQNIAGCPG